MKKAKVLLSKVISSSMAPLINQGDSVNIELCDYSAVKIGNIAWFKLEEGINVVENGKVKKTPYLVHRIVDRKNIHGKNYFAHKGDAVIGAPALISYENVVGKVIGIEKKTGLVLDLRRVKWKIVDFLFAVSSILEYRISRIFSVVFRFLPGKIRFYLKRKFVEINFGLKKIILRSCLFVLKRF